MKHYRTRPAATTPPAKGVAEKSAEGASQTGSEGASGSRRWTVVVPAYNEEDFLRTTLDSLAAQTVSGAAFVLVDNKSTDGTRAVMEAFAAENPACDVVILTDVRPGKINALETGLEPVATEFVALCDADTIYPPAYLERAEAMFGAPKDRIVGAFAFGVYSDAGPLGAWLTKAKGALAAALMPGQGHTGGYGHTFRTAALKAAGGYSAELWPFMVADHEVVNRIAKLGAIAYRRDHWCLTSARREGRGNVDWKLHERILYNLTPPAKKDWLFYEYLRPRFEKRKFYNANLRRRDWEADAP